MKLLIPILLISLVSFGQNDFVQLDITVELDSKVNDYSGTEFQVYENDSLIGIEVSDSLGKNSLNYLQLQHKYNLKFSHEGFVTKVISIDLTISEDSINKNSLYQYFKFNLFRPKRHERFTFLEHTPFVIMEYDSDGILSFRQKEFRHILKKIDLCQNGLTDEQSEQYFYLTGNPEIKDSLKHYYDLAIELGDIFFQNERYFKARLMYRKAQELFPSDQYPDKVAQYPVEMIERCNNMLEEE